MEIFGPDPEEERKDIIEDILDLYNDMNGKNIEELEKSHCAYEREYKKILQKLHDHYNQDILGSEAPPILEELIQEVESPELVMGTTTIKRVEMGIRKISRKLKIELPEKKEELSKERTNLPQIIVNANPSMNTAVYITNEIKIEIDQATRDLEEELNKPTPDPSKLKTLLKIIKKGAGHGAIKAVEILLKKYCGL